MKIKRTVYHKEGYKKVAQEVEIQLTVEELKQAHDEYDYLWKRPWEENEQKDV